MATPNANTLESKFSITSTFFSNISRSEIIVSNRTVGSKILFSILSTSLLSNLAIFNNLFEENRFESSPSERSNFPFYSSSIILGPPDLYGTCKDTKSYDLCTLNTISWDIYHYIREDMRIQAKVELIGSILTITFY